MVSSIYKVNRLIKIYACKIEIKNSMIKSTPKRTPSKGEAAGSKEAK